MAARTTDRRLVFVKAADMTSWRCRPVGMVDVLDLQDRVVGRLDGIVVDAPADEPRFLVVRSEGDGLEWSLVPVGDGWFDQGTHAIRIDVDARSGGAIPFEPDEFERMTPEQVGAYERQVLARCCPEVGFGRDGTPHYARTTAFRCPPWLREVPPPDVESARGE